MIMMDRCPSLALFSQVVFALQRIHNFTRTWVGGAANAPVGPIAWITVDEGSHHSFPLTDWNLCDLAFKKGLQFIPAQRLLHRSIPSVRTPYCCPKTSDLSPVVYSGTQTKSSGLPHLLCARRVHATMTRNTLLHLAAQPIVNGRVHQRMHFLGKESGIEALVDPARYVRPFAAVKTSAAAPYDAVAFDGEFDLVLDIAPRLGPMGSFQHVALPVERASYCGAAMSRNSKKRRQKPGRDVPFPGQED